MDTINSTRAECESRGETPSSALLSHDQHRQATTMQFFCPGPAGPLCNPNHSYETATLLHAHRDSSAHNPLERCVWRCCKDLRFTSVAALATHYDAGACAAMSRLALNRHMYIIDAQHGSGQQSQSFVVDNEQLPVEERKVMQFIAANLEWAEMTGHYECLQKYCYLTFTSYRKLEIHMRSSLHYYDPYLYRCGACFTSFQMLSGLAGHVANGACGVDSAAVGLQIKELMKYARLSRRLEMHTPIV